MRLVLNQGESITVCLADSDGEITVSFGYSSVTVETDLPDTTGRQGVIYEENFSNLRDYYGESD